MSQKEVAIVGKNNTRAAVTGQEELLVRLSTASPATTTTGTVYRAIVENIVGATWTISGAYQITIRNVGTGTALVSGGALNVDDVVSFTAPIGGILADIDIDATLTEVLINYVIL